MAKQPRKSKVSAQEQEHNELSNLVQSKPFELIGKPLKPMSAKQKLYIQAMDTNSIVFGLGPAGTGKSACAVHYALERLAAGDIKKIILTRPAVEGAGESLGFLPGDQDEKFNVYLTPVLEMLKERLKPGQLEYLLKSNKIEALPLAFIRGRTFNDAVVILDEAQNARDMKAFLTRIGKNCKLLINGDELQSDLKEHEVRYGLADAVARIARLPGVAIIDFTKADVVRSGLCQQILETYER